MDKNFTKLSVAIFATDETDSLAETVNIILNTCNIEDLHEITFFVWQKTTTKCRAVIDRIMSEDTGVPMRIFEQFMKTSAEDLEYFLENYSLGSHVVFVPSDLEVQPELIAWMIEAGKANPGKLITTSRWSGGGRTVGYPAGKYILNLFGRMVIRLAFRTKQTDATNAFQMCPSEYLKAIRYSYNGMRVMVDMNFKLIRLGVGFVELPVSWKPRGQGKSNSSFLKNIFLLHVLVRDRLTPRRNYVKQPEIFGLK